MAFSADNKSLSNVFAAAVEYTDALILVTDKAGTLEYANKAFCNSIGYPTEDLIGKTLRDFAADSQEKHKFPEICSAIQQQDPWRGELTYKTASDDLLFCQTTVAPILDGENQLEYCVWTHLDITEQKELERKHHQSEVRLHSILDNIPAYVFSKDSQGRYTYVNKMLSMLHARHVDSIIGQTDFELFPQNAAETFTKNDRLVFERAKTIRALEDGGMDEFGIKRSYLSVKCPLVNDDGDVEELLGMSVDISEQQRLEQALRDSEEKLSSILNNMKARVYIKDSELKYTYANQELCRILNTDHVNIIGKDDYQLFEPETAVGFRATDEEVLKSGKKVSRMEMSIEPDTGDKRYYWSVKVPLMDAHGVPHSLLGISTDITKQKRLEKALRRNEKQLSTILDNMKAHVYIKDINFNYTYVNANMCDYLGKTRDEIVGNSDEAIFGREHSDHFRKVDRQVLDFSESCSSIEESTDAQTGDMRYFWSVKVPLINDIGNPYAILGISTDVTEQKRLEDELRKLASTDVLTGIYNRRHFLELCEKEVQRAQRYDHDLSLIMLDVDHFKQINDTFGHSVGDEAIKAMTRICQENMRTTDVLGRLGGEEFALLLPETDTTGAWHIAQRIRKMAEDSTFDTGTDAQGSFTASFGLTGFLASDQTPDDILKRADVALYDAKKQGRNRVCEK